MLTAMVAVDNIVTGVTEKANIWAINTEQEYHEEKGASKAPMEEYEKDNLSPRAGHIPEPALMASSGTGQESFKDFLNKHPWNRVFLWIAGIAIVVQFVIFKYLYPQAGFISGDSYVYIQTAYWNFPINTYPVGYSKFLRLFSVFTTSDTALVAFQYLFIQCSALYFLFTLFYFHRPGKVVQSILFACILFNPLSLYLSNYVSSDALFLALSLLWFTLLVWIIQRPALRLIVIQSIVLLLAFMVRYNALIYPLIAALALFLARGRLWMKITGIAASLVLIAVFMWYTSNQYHELMGVRQFSPFSGWQLANNAMYAYRYVDSADRKPAPGKFRALDRMVRNYFDTTRDVKKHPQEMLVASTVYMWDPISPLQIYMNQQFKKDTAAGPVKRWATMAPSIQIMEPG